MTDTLQKRIANLSPTKRALVEQRMGMQAPAPAGTGAQGQKELVAYVVPRQGSRVTVPELREFLRERLPEYMVPSAFMFLERVPLLPNGKVDRRALPQAGFSRVEAGAGFVPPRGPVEMALARIWSEVLGRASVGAHDNFFELGGHSLLATQVVSRVREAFQIELPVVALFEEPTVAGLARRVQQGTEGAQSSARPALVPAPREGELPLSFAQQRLWFLDQLEPGGATYNLPAALRLTGTLSAAALQKSLDALVERHEALRTVFPTVDGHAVQRVLPSRQVDLPTMDLQYLAEAEREAEARRLAQEEACRPFDLARGPLLRAVLLQLGAQEHVLLLTLHHIVADGWSTEILVRELSALYQAFVRDEPCILPPLPIQYADFAVWQRRWLGAEVLEREIAHWRKRLAGAPAALDLPTDHPRAAVLRYRGAKHSLSISREVVERLSALCREEGVTPFMALLAALSSLLGRYTRQQDIVVGSPVANRSQLEVEGLIGCFVNTLVLRTDLSGEPTTRELLRRVREVTLDAYAHQEVPFEKLVDALQPERDLSRHPLVQVVLALENESSAVLELPGLTLSPIDVDTGTSKFDLTFLLSETRQGLSGYIEYNTDLFEAPTIARMAGHLGLLLEGMVREPDRKVSHLPLLSAVERAQLLKGRAEHREYPREPSLTRLFEAQAERRPQACAVRYEDRQLTYAELNARANQLAHHLRALGVGKGAPVALCMERSLELVVALLGILKAGGGYVPMEPSNPKDRLAFALEDSGTRVVITERAVADRLPAWSGHTLVLEDARQAIAGQSVANLDEAPGADDLAYIIYTSGSTGRPKGVLVDHGHVVRLMNATHPWFGFSEQDVWTLFHSYAFDFSVWELWGALVYGGTLVVVPYWVSRSPEDFYRLLCRERVTVLNQTPSAFRQLIHAEGTLGVDEALALRFVIFGGEALEFQSLQPWFDRHGDARPRLVNMYGITETTVHVTYRPVSQADLRLPSGSLIGVPIPDLQVYVLDEAQQLAPIGVPGEMYVGGAGVARGYLNRPELTEQRFLPDTLSGRPGARLYRSGDLARYTANGDLEYLGRIDHQVKIRGFRIETGEIEAILVQHPAVREAAVLIHVRPGAEPSLVAYLVSESAGLSVGELRAFLKEKLPEYMVPAAFVMLDALPLTSNGKLDRRALPAPEMARAVEQGPYVAPRSPEEQTLTRVWAELLGREKVGIHDNFFELGGDSILAIQVVAAARREGLEISPKQLFQFQTVAELAKVAVAARAPVEQEVVTGPVALTPIQRWFLEQELPAPHHWNQSLLLDVKRPLDPQLLEKACQALVSHHDALRLRFTRSEEGWRQAYAQAGEAAICRRFDLSGIPEAEQPRALEEAASELQASLDLAAGPLFRVGSFHLGLGRPERLLLVIHHLVVDGVSWRILVEDLQTAYEQLERGEAVRLPPKTTSYQQWATRLEEHARSERLRRESAWWSSQPWERAHRLPVEASAGANIEGSARAVTGSLQADETEALLRQVPEAYRTRIEDVLLTALARSFATAQGLTSVVIDLEGHGREDLFEDVDVSRTVGWFTSIYPILLEGTAEGDVGQALRTTKERLRAVPGKGVGYGLLRYLTGEQGPRELARVPRAEVSFNYLGQLDAAVPGSALFTLGTGGGGAPRDPRAPRRHLLDVTASVVGGRLQVEWTYSENVHTRERVEALVSSYLAALRQLITHCLSAEAGGFTPSDFPLAALTEQQLAQLPVAPRQVEDLYPLSSMQQGFWLYSLYASETGVGSEQTTFTLEGALELAVFERAWQAVIDRHAILRTGFVSEGLERPVQVVHRQARLPVRVEDWSALPASEQQGRFEAYVREDLQKGFELARPPLMRLGILRLAEERFRIVWTHHHLLMDGWSLPLVLREVVAFYTAFLRGETPRIDRPRPYRDFIAWQQQQDSTEAEAYWREALRGFAAPTPLVVDRSPEKVPAEAGHREESLQLPEPLTAALESLGRKHHLTWNTLLQGAWALLLSRYSGESDIVFGTTVSGRPSELTGIESMVGLFINIVPTRVQVSEESSLVEWLKEFQARQLRQRQYEYSPLFQVQQWSQVPASLPLFDSLFVFENYPVRPSSVAEGMGSEQRGLTVGDIDAPVRTRYRLTLVAVPGASLSLSVSYDGSQVAPGAVRRMLGHLRGLLAALAEQPDQPVGRVPMLSPEELRLLLGEWGTQPGSSARRYLLDARGRPVPPGIPGEVWAGEAPVEPVEPVNRARLTRTGELARYLPDGRLEVLGRAEERIRIGGVEVLPGELGLALSRHPAVKDCAVVPRADLSDSPMLVAYVVPRPGASVSAPELRTFLQAQVPDPYVPAAFVLLEALPRSVEGKLELGLLPMPQPGDSGTSEFVAPRTPTEKALASIWSELVGGRRIGAFDDFFDLGGQSVLAIQMLSRVRKAFGVELPVQSIFSRRTVAGISEELDTLKAASAGGAPLPQGGNPFDRAPLVRLPPRDAYELSPYQLPEWYFSQLAPDSPMYNILSCDVLFTGELDLRAMAKAWETVVNRHGVFRATFGYVDGKPVQRIQPPRRITVEDIYLDYRWVPEDRFLEETTRLAHEYADTTLDSRNGPMFHLKMAEFPGKRFLMLFLTNHVLWDEVSSINMSAELREAYSAIRAGREPRLPALEVDYVDYAHWVNRGVETGLFERERRYWLDRFKDNPAPLDLPTDFARPAQQTFSGSDVSGAIPREATRRLLQEYLREHNDFTLSMFLHAVLNLLLYRLSGQTDIVIGMPIANRGDQRLEKVMGPFATGMPMRCILDGEMTFDALMRHTRQVTLEALDHYAYPSVVAIQEINPRWDVSRGRLFSVMYGLQHNKTQFWSEMRLDGMETSRMEHLANIGPLHSTSRTDLRLIVEELGPDILYSFSYNSDLFKRSTVERFAEQYNALVEQVITQPHLRIEDYRMMSPAEERRLIQEFNRTEEPFDLEGGIHERFERQVDLTPDATALEQDERRWTYRELDAEANRWAHELLGLGVALEEKVGVMLDPSPELVIAILAILKAGAAYVPVMPEQPAARKGQILESAGARFLLTHGDVHRGDFPFSGQALLMDALRARVSAHAATRPERKVEARNLAIVFFTSGSTGVPKGIEIEHRGISNLIASTQGVYGLEPSEATLFFSPFNFDASLLELFWPLAVGARIALPRAADVKNPVRLGQLIHRHGVAVIQCVPLMLSELIEARAHGEIPELPSLRYVMCAGAVMSRELRDRFTQVFSGMLANHYGPTEATVDTTRFDTRLPFDGETVPIGKPISNTRVYVLDKQRRPVPVGVPGELYISSVGLARGYLGDPEKTAAHFVTDPFSPEPGARMYRTGDLGKYAEDGNLYFLGRVDRQVKVRGNRVELDEVEARLSALPSVGKCVVRHHKEPGVDCLVGYVQLKDTVNAIRTRQARFRLFTLAQRPELKLQMDALHVGTWPEYFSGDPVMKEYWPRLASELPRCQFALVDERDKVVAVGNALPIAWDGTVEGLPRGWDGGLEQGFTLARAGGSANTLMVLAGVVDESASGQGLSTLILQGFKGLARALGLERVLVPVRPTGKGERPELSFEAWCDLRREDGQLQDHWLRVHERVGGRRLKIDLRSQYVRASLQDWERWAGRGFPSSGEYAVPGAMQPVRIDVEQGFGEYHDPSVWVEHPGVDQSRVPSEHVDGAALREALRQFLPEYMVPEHFRFLLEMPLTLSGKVNEKALPAFELQPTRVEKVPPRTELQAQLVELWRELLKVEEVGVTDNFFDLGGHSIRAVQLLAKITDLFQVTLPLKELFREGTIRHLEKLILEARVGSGGTVSSSPVKP